MRDVMRDVTIKPLLATRRDWLQLWKHYANDAAKVCKFCNIL